MSKFIFSPEFGSSSGETRITTFLNHYSYLLARKDKELFSQFNEIYCDGIVLCLFLRLVGVRKYRMSFDMTSLAPKIFSYAVERERSIYFVGGKPGIAELAVSKLMVGYPQLKVVGSRHGYFSSSLDRDSFIREVAEQSPDIVIASMGTPFQEQLLVDLKAAGWVGEGYTCGGFLHQMAKAGLRYYPAWIDSLNLRWAFRIYDEPKLVKRYTFDFVKFIGLFFYDVFLSELQDEKSQG